MNVVNLQQENGKLHVFDATPSVEAIIVVRNWVTALGRTLADLGDQIVWSTVIRVRRPINYCMELHGLIDDCVCVLSDLGRIGGWNYEERWSRIDGEELAMAANGGSWMQRNAGGSGGFGRKPTDTWWAFG
jgi:hypothetical protein